MTAARWTTTEPSADQRTESRDATLERMQLALNDAFLASLGGTDAAFYGHLDGILQYAAELVHNRLSPKHADPDTVLAMREAARRGLLDGFTNVNGHPYEQSV